jgi:hypothetical protein
VAGVGGDEDRAFDQMASQLPIAHASGMVVQMEEKRRRAGYVSYVPAQHRLAIQTIATIHNGFCQYQHPRAAFSRR